MPSVFAAQRRYTTTQIINATEAAFILGTRKPRQLVNVVPAGPKVFLLIHLDYSVYISCALEYYAFLLILCMLRLHVD